MQNTADATAGYRSAGYLRYRLSSLEVWAERSATEAELYLDIATRLLHRDRIRDRALERIARAARFAADRAKDRASELDWTGTRNSAVEAWHLVLEARAVLRPGGLTPTPK